MLEHAAAANFPVARLLLEEQRTIELHGRVEIDELTWIDLYCSAATGKQSYALIHNGARIFGYDNFRYWHRHPVENPADHVPCAEPTPDQAFKEMAEVVRTLNP